MIFQSQLMDPIMPLLDIRSSDSESNDDENASHSIKTKKQMLINKLVSQKSILSDTILELKKNYDFLSEEIVMGASS